MAGRAFFIMIVSADSEALSKGCLNQSYAHHPIDFQQIILPPQSHASHKSPCAKSAHRLLW